MSLKFKQFFKNISIIVDIVQLPILSSSMFLQFIPQQPPQAGMHFNPYFLQAHNIKPHKFFEVALQLQWITCRRKSGTGGKPVLIGFRTSPHLCQPQSHGSRPQSISSLVALIIFKWTRREWKYAALLSAEMKQVPIVCC